jgi:hypothetical protein
MSWRIFLLFILLWCGGGIHSFANLSKNGVNYSGRGHGGRRSSCGKSGACPDTGERKACECRIRNSSAHQRSNCPVWNMALAFMKKSESGGGSAPDQRIGNSGGGASPGRANYRGGARNSVRVPSLSALTSTTALLLRDAYLPVPEDEDWWEESEN